MSVRLVVAILLLGSLAVGLWWTSSTDPQAATIGEGRFKVFVVGPGGDLFSNGSVQSRATPFDVLVALAAENAFGIETEEQTWIGDGCTATYVVGIAGHHESVTGGWNYYTRQPGEEWSWRSAGAACHPLVAGEQVEWCWVEGDTCSHHIP
ncbi:MAG: hypothetical protein ACYC2H_11065 [Thermoplasmatota archaeon]